MNVIVIDVTTFDCYFQMYGGSTGPGQGEAVPSAELDEEDDHLCPVLWGWEVPGDWGVRPEPLRPSLGHPGRDPRRRTHGAQVHQLFGKS